MGTAGGGGSGALFREGAGCIEKERSLLEPGARGAGKPASCEIGESVAVRRAGGRAGGAYSPRVLQVVAFLR